jgi:hypothetical protein
MSNQNTKIDCCICYNEIFESNLVFHKSEIINTCKDCINLFKNEKKNFINKFMIEDCLKSIKRMVNNGIPIYVLENYEELYDNDNREINNIYTYIEKERIIECNKKIKNESYENNESFKDKVIDIFIEYGLISLSLS